MRDLYEGLTASSPDGEVIPASATSWQVSDDGKTYMFQLRRDAQWSNGDPLTAANFVEGFRRALDPRTSSGAADLLRAIDNAPDILRGITPADQLGVRAVDDWTLEIRLSHAVPYFPDILTNTVASPVHPSSLEDSGGYSRPGSTVSNGPYVLSAFAPGASLVLKRNSRYWDATAVEFDEVRYEFISDENSEFTRFRSGEIDVTNTVPEQRFQELLAAKDARLQHRSTLATFYFTLNTDRGPLRGKPGLREALSLAVDRDVITGSVTRAGQEPAYSLVPNDAWNYVAAPPMTGVKLTAEKRIAQARDLYAKAGYSTERPLRLRLLYNENELIQRVCIAIAAMWKEVLGVETELVQMEFKAYLTARADPGQWDVVRVGWTADYNDASTFLDTMTLGQPAELRPLVERRVRASACPGCRGNGRIKAARRAAAGRVVDARRLPAAARLLLRDETAGAAAHRRAGDQSDEPDVLEVLPARALVQSERSTLAALTSSSRCASNFFWLTSGPSWALTVSNGGGVVARFSSSLITCQPNSDLTGVAVYLPVSSC